jgi:hypothetical protein
MAGANQDTSLTMKRINRKLHSDQAPGNPLTNRKKPEDLRVTEVLPGSLIHEITPLPSFEPEKQQSNMFDLVKNAVHWKNAAVVPQENIYNLHLKMNEIFSLHDDLCLMAMKINGMYQFGEGFF